MGIKNGVPRFLIVVLILVFLFSTQAFAFDISDIPDNTLKLGDDFFDMDSNALKDPAAAIPIQSLLKSGINQNKAYFKIGGRWYDPFNLTAEQFLNPVYALTEEQVQAIQGFGKWYKAGDEVVFLSGGKIKSAAAPAAFKASIGTERADLNLPATVNAVLEDNSPITVPVVWDEGTPAYNKEVARTYVFTGTPAPQGEVTNPDNIKVSVNVTVVIPNNDPNPNTALNISSGTAIFEFDTTEELAPSTTAKVESDTVNVVSGSGSIKLSPLVPEAGDPGESILSVQSKVPLGSALQNVQTLEFNLYVPDVSQFNYMLINFYIDKWHSYYFQTGIGNWQLVAGWNKIRRNISDFTYIDSINGTSVSMAALKSSAVSGSDPDSTAVKGLELQKSIDRFNTLYKQKHASGAGAAKSSIQAAAPDAAATWATINAMEISVVYNSSKTPSINIDRIALNPIGAARILFTFDDAWYDVLKYGYPILEAKGFKATTWVNKGSAVNANSIPVRGSMDMMNEADLTSLYSAGWDIGNHTVSHSDRIDLLSDVDLRKEFLDNQDWIQSHGWTRGAQHVCYPSGIFNERIINILKEAGIGVKSARTTEYGLEPAPLYNMYKLKCITIGRDSSFDDPNDKYSIKREIDRAVATGSTLFFMLHRVEETPIMDDTNEYNRLAVSTAKLSQIADYIYTLVQQDKTRVMTVSGWYDAYMQNK